MNFSKEGYFASTAGRFDGVPGPGGPPSYFTPSSPPGAPYPSTAGRFDGGPPSYFTPSSPPGAPYQPFMSGEPFFSPVMGQQLFRPQFDLGYTDQPSDEIAFVRLPIPDKYMGLVVGKGGQNLAGIKAKNNVSTKVNRKTQTEGMSELCISGSWDAIEGCKSDIITLFIFRKIQHEEFTSNWPSADQQQPQQQQQQQQQQQFPPSFTGGAVGAGGAAGSSAAGRAQAEGDDDDEIMVYEQPGDAVPVPLNQSRNFQQPDGPGPGSPSRSGYPSGDSRMRPPSPSGGRPAERASDEGLQGEDAESLRNTYRIQEQTIQELKKRVDFCELRNERLVRQIQSNMSNTEEIVFLKLELEEKGRLAEGYRVDNYKLLQRLEALIRRLDTVEDENEALRRLLNQHPANSSTDK